MRIVLGGGELEETAVIEHGKNALNTCPNPWRPSHAALRMHANCTHSCHSHGLVLT